GELARGPKSERVTREVMEAACNLARWCGNEAERIYGTLAETQEQREQRKLMEFVESRGCAITVRDVITFYRPLRNQPEKARQAFDKLVKTGRGRWEELHPPGRGRPTRIFQLLQGSASAKIVE